MTDFTDKREKLHDPCLYCGREEHFVRRWLDAYGLNWERQRCITIPADDYLPEGSKAITNEYNERELVWVGVGHTD